MSKRPTTKIRAKGAKSFKADGTPKKRWSASERAERGHSPRKSGGRPRSERDERGFEGRSDRGFNRDRDDRGERGDRRDNRDNRFGGDRRDDRGERGERRWDNDRGGRWENRGDRGARGGSWENRGDRRDERGDRNDRGPRSGSWENRGRRWEDRGERTDRGDRNDRWGNNDRGPRKWEDRGERTDRGSRWGNDSRDDRGRGDDRRDNRRPEHRPHPNRSWENRERRRDEKREWGNDRGFRRDRDDRGFGRREEREERTEWADQDDFDGGADTMSWTATELEEVDTAAVADDAGFAELGLPKVLVGALDQQGITSPFPIQAATIPDALAGKDVLGRGRTGSGKTLGFGLPLLARLANGEAAVSGAPGAIVLVPTRELALQVADVLAPLAKVVGLSTTLVAGGMAFGPQIKAFDRGVDVVVATPGRLIDLMEQGVADLSKVQISVLDEADHMADLGFMEAVTTILDATPADGQRLLFSATLDRGVDRLVQRYLTDPVTHEVDSAKASVSTMRHHILHVLPHDKNLATAAIANREGRTVVFVRTQRGADRVAEQLRQAGVTAGALHGGLTQGARARMLKAFKDGSVPVLVATDVAARGIHVDEVSLVLQVDPPMGPKDYLHRAGRTARAGMEGHVVTITLPHQRKTMRRLTDMAGVKVDPVQVRPGDELMAELTGARMPEGEPVTEEAFQALIAPPRPVRKPRSGPRKRGWGRDSFDDRGPRRGGKFHHGRRPRD